VESECCVSESECRVSYWPSFILFVGIRANLMAVLQVRLDRLAAYS
jgi:hypothetical protein